MYILDLIYEKMSINYTTTDCFCASLLCSSSLWTERDCISMKVSWNFKADCVESVRTPVSIKVSFVQAEGNETNILKKFRFEFINSNWSLSEIKKRRYRGTMFEDDVFPFIEFVSVSVFDHWFPWQTKHVVSWYHDIDEIQSDVLLICANKGKKEKLVK